MMFLATLERHFHILAEAPLAAVADALPPLMSALSIVWALSRHYGDDIAMGALLQRISSKSSDAMTLLFFSNVAASALYVSFIQGFILRAVDLGSQLAR